jgi:hypothetical protein
MINKCLQRLWVSRKTAVSDKARVHTLASSHPIAIGRKPRSATQTTPLAPTAILVQHSLRTSSPQQ